MSRRSQPIPFANWLTSRDSALRERAETALYHLGPDAGTALFAAAERVTQPYDFLRIATVLLCRVAITGTIGYLIINQFNIRGLGSEIIWAVTVCMPVLNALEATVRVALSRRQKLKVLGLALAKRNDLRAIGPLLEAWQPTGFLRLQRSDDEIEHELTRLMPLFLRQKSLDLRTYKKRHLRRKTRRLFSRRVVDGRLRPHADLNDQRADLVVTILQMLSRSGAAQDRALLERVSRIHAESTNSLYVRDAAAVCLERQTAEPPAIGPQPNAEAHSSTTPGVAVGPAPVVIRR